MSTQWIVNGNQGLYNSHYQLNCHHWDTFPVSLTNSNMVVWHEGKKEIESVTHSDPFDFLLAATNAKTCSKATLLLSFQKWTFAVLFLLIYDCFRAVKSNVHLGLQDQNWEQYQIAVFEAACLQKSKTFEKS